ncbi:MAG: radical SAM protein [Candidatus Thorarchaeota archaeon]|jgi:biotin synthase
MKTVEEAPGVATEESRESPEYVRTSLAAAMTMGKIPGKFYRDAKLYCINILLTYDEGCHAKCAYCGLSGTRESEEEWADSSFIRVDWPIFSVAEIKEAITTGKCPHVERSCISMITLGNARDDCISVVSELSEVIPRISVLITPTIVNKDWLIRVKDAGADKVGIAVDAATEEIFDKLRGKEVQGPHKWSKYWETVKESVEVFGRENVGIHLIVGIGETEEEMIDTIQRAQDIGARTHLFSFFPEEGSVLENHPQPPLGSYRRIQLARYIVNYDIGTHRDMKFNDNGQVIDFGLTPDEYERVLNIGEAFMTSGCKGETKENACNRPMGNCTPFQASIGHWRNFPIDPNDDDMRKIQEQLNDYSLTYEVDETYLDDE